MTCSEFVAKVTLPLKFAAEVGANVIETVVVAPPLMVRGRAMLPMENPAPLKVACVTWISAPPIFETTTGIVLLLPTVTFPKLADDGAKLSRPLVTAVPVALTDTTGVWELWVSNPIVIVGSPELTGENWTLKETDCPAATVSGMLTPVIWKPEPSPTIELMVMGDEVPLVSVSDMVLVVPTGIAPKFKDEASTVTVPDP